MDYQPDNNTFEKAQQGPSHESIRQSWFSGIGLAYSQSLIFCTIALYIWYSGKLVSHGYISKKKLFVTIMIWVSIRKVIVDTANSMTNDLVKGFNVVGLIFTIHDRYTKIDSDDSEGFIAEKIIGKIKFYNVHFSYPARPRVMVFQGFSIKVDVEKSIALIGENGSEKSKIIELIERFYDPIKRIETIDGRDLKSYKLKLHTNQEPTLFSDTIRENIAYGA